MFLSKKANSDTIKGHLQRLVGGKDLGNQLGGNCKSDILTEMIANKLLLLFYYKIGQDKLNWAVI